VKHFKPLSLVIILATLYGLLFHFLINNLFDVEQINTKGDVISAYQKVSQWITDHFAYSTLILILTTTISSYLVFKRKGYNFAEHLVLNTFYWGLVLVINFLFFPVLYIYFNNNAERLKSYGYISQIFDFVLMYWCYSQFFNKIPKIERLGLILLTFLILSIINIVMGYVTGWIVSSL
jgi:hypothetical protein